MKSVTFVPHPRDLADFLAETRHAFDVWGLNRIEILTDFLNTKSRAAIARGSHPPSAAVRALPRQLWHRAAGDRRANVTVK